MCIILLPVLYHGDYIVLYCTVVVSDSRASIMNPCLLVIDHQFLPGQGNSTLLRYCNPFYNK